jgi:hypothetical protein
MAPGGPVAPVQGKNRQIEVEMNPQDLLTDCRHRGAA